MNNQSKILASLIVGIAIGAALGILFLSKTGQGIHDLLSQADGANSQSGNDNPEDDWSDLNDSLGG